MQLARGVVLNGNGHSLTLIVVEGLLDLNIVVALVDRQGDQALRHRADFLRAGEGGFDAAVPDQIGHLVTKKRLTLSSVAAAEFTLSHVVFPPISARLLQIQFFTRRSTTPVRC